MPFGIIGVINAGKVESLFKKGDYEGAKAASNKARRWTLIGFVLGLILDLILLVGGVSG